MDVGASTRQPGSSRGTGPDSGTTPDRSSRPSPPAAAPGPTCSTDLCRSNYGVGTVPDVTLADLASFTPARPSLTGEPAGLGVVGMPTNLVAAASEHRLRGPLLGYDVVVRFAPAAFRFDYGDGTTRTSATGGATWARLGQASFTPTPTSHVYRAPGAYAVRVTVLYSASVDFGSGTWHPVAGYVEASTGGYGVRVVEVHTALVARTCLENPAGPGC